MGHHSIAVSHTAPHVLVCRWNTAQQLTHHTTPVLSLCTAPLPVFPPTNPPSSHSQPPQHSQASQHSQVPQHSAGAAILGRRNSPDQRLGSRGSTQLVWSGATNGSFAAWLVTDGDDPELHDHQHSQQSQQPQRQHLQDQQQQQQPLQQQRQAQALAQALVQAQPQGRGRQHGRLVWSAEHWHQSGINALHAAPTAGTAPILPPARLHPTPLFLAHPTPSPTASSAATCYHHQFLLPCRLWRAVSLCLHAIIILGPLC